MRIASNGREFKLRIQGVRSEPTRPAKKEMEKQMRTSNRSPAKLTIKQSNFPHPGGPILFYESAN